MKLLLKVISLCAVINGSAFTQTYSEITYDAGTTIEVQLGADVCATNIYVNGAFTGGGTFCTGALPVLLSEFSYSVLTNTVHLKWKTTAELNNSGFDVERKADEPSAEWLKIAFIAGYGTTTEPKEYFFEDRKLQTGRYRYRLKQVDYNGNFEYFELNDAVIIAKPGEFSIGQNYPNPSNPNSIIEFQVPEKAEVNISIYNLIGQLVSVLVNGVMEPGHYSVEFDGRSMPSGTYLYRFSAGSFTAVKKMILVK